jgi:hypothetical protein
MTNGKAGWYVVALSGLVGGSAVGVGLNFVGASWKIVALCAMLGVAIGTLLYKQAESAPPNRSLIQLARGGRPSRLQGGGADRTAPPPSDIRW